MANPRIVDSEQMAFDYGAFPAPVAIEAAQRIRLHLRRSPEDIIEIGRDPLAVTASLPHGSFLHWIEVELGMGEVSARSFMRTGKSTAHPETFVRVARMGPPGFRPPGKESRYHSP